MARSFFGVFFAVALVLASNGGVAQGAGDRRAVSPIDQHDQAAEQARIAALVRDLGAPTFTARQQAQRELIGFGSRAKEALEAACHDPDREIQRRAKAALNVVHDVNFYVRLEEFRADSDPAASHDLAGWHRFRACVGSSAPARRLFVEMQRAERELLELVESAPRQAGALLDLRCLQAQAATSGDNEHQPTLSLGSIAAIVFAAGEPDVPVSTPAGDCINGFTKQTAFAQALTSKQMSPVIRGLLGVWVGREFERESITTYRNLIMAMQYQLKNGVAPALSIVESPGGQPHLEQYAILAIGKLGERKHVPALLPLLNDTRPVGVPDRTGRQSDTQIRDVALAALIYLTEQKLSEYGFVHAKVNPSILFNTNTLGFNDPAARDQALAKWRSWWAQHGE